MRIVLLINSVTELKKSWQYLVILGVIIKLLDPHFDYNFGEYVVDQR